MDSRIWAERLSEVPRSRGKFQGQTCPGSRPDPTQPGDKRAGPRRAPLGLGTGPHLGMVQRRTSRRGGPLLREKAGDRQGGWVLGGEQMSAEAWVWSAGVLGEGLGRRQVCLGLSPPFS